MRRRSTWFFLLARASPMPVLMLAMAGYLSLFLAVPGWLEDQPAMAPLSRLCAAAAPLVGIVLLLPLPLSLWRAWRERALARRLSDLDGLRALNWHELEMVVRYLFEQQGYAA